MRWFRGDGTYLWLSGSSLKKDCMAAIIQFSVPRSITRSTGHPQYSPQHQENRLPRCLADYWIAALHITTWSSCFNHLCNHKSENRMVSVYHSHRNTLSSLDLGFDKSFSLGGVLFLNPSLPGPSLEEVPVQRRAVLWFLLAVVCATPTCILVKIHGRK